MPLGEEIGLKLIKARAPSRRHAQKQWLAALLRPAVEESFERAAEKVSAAICMRIIKRIND